MMRLSERFRHVAGVDAAYLSDGDPDGVAAMPLSADVVAAVAAAVTVRLLDLRVVDVAYSVAAKVDEYRAGRFAQREGAVALKAINALRFRPDVVIAHGHGRAHPGRYGLACWLGDRVDLPTLGCCNNPLLGTHGEVGPNPGDRADLIHGGDVVGAAVRTNRNMNPVYISVGGGIDLDSAVKVVVWATAPDLFRLPLPLRLADVVSRGLLRSFHRIGQRTAH